jgi:hypothetical protein
MLGVVIETVLLPRGKSPFSGKSFMEHRRTHVFQPSAVPGVLAVFHVLGGGHRFRDSYDRSTQSRGQNSQGHASPGFKFIIPWDRERPRPHTTRASKPDCGLRIMES